MARILEWVQNLPENQKYFAAAKPTVKGEPKATATESVEDLKRLGMVGIYIVHETAHQGPEPMAVLSERQSQAVALYWSTKQLAQRIRDTKAWALAEHAARVRVDTLKLCETLGVDPIKGDFVEE